jgi:molybdopterin molybdotransferase
LPGNPLSHFVCFHLFVTTALAKMTGAEPQKFLRGLLAEKLDDAQCPRETLWPARFDAAGLHPLKWSSSGDVTCFAAANALIRVPPNVAGFTAGAEVEFWPADF